MNKNDNYISKQYKDILHIFLPTWTRNIYYINTENIEKYKNILNNWIGIKNIGHVNENAVGNFSVYINNGTPVGVIRCDKKKIPELAHECLHATFWIMEDIGLELCEHSEEAFCYTQMALLREILKRSKQ